VIEGVISLGTVGADRKTFYLYDGQHRIEAAKISGLKEFIADVRICHFDDLTQMGTEYVRLNSQISRMRPDDVLRGLEGSVGCIRVIRTRCEFVGYDNIRRGGNSPMLSMSATIRCWTASNNETPSLTGAGSSAMVMAQGMTMTDAEECCQFLNVARAAWGADLENARLWSNLNLSVCMWLWRSLVLGARQNVSKRTVVLNADQFKRCLMMVSSQRDYIDWLVGRNMNERDRAPCYARVKQLFVARLRLDKMDNVKMPQPSWASR
jgi:hypothetical protein